MNSEKLRCDKSHFVGSNPSTIVPMVPLPLHKGGKNRRGEHCSSEKNVGCGVPDAPFI